MEVRHRPGWTPETDALLIEALRQNTSLQRLVVRFKKSAGSIRARANDFGLKLPIRARAPKEQTEEKRWVASKPRR